MRIRYLFALISLAALIGCGPKTKVDAPPPPITTATPVSLQFVDVTGPAGIKFVHNNGAFGAKLMPETMGSGAAFIDYDGDGYQDLFFVNSRDWTDAEVNDFKNGTGREQTKDYGVVIPATRPQHRTTCALYHNNGDGTFTDVTEQAGLDIEMYGMGAAVGDYDNDGKPDLYVTALGRNYLFHNEGGGKFKDVAAQAGLLDGGWSTSAAWVDYDKDGKLDLFVCHYVAWTPRTDIPATLYGNRKSYSTPEQYNGQFCRLYHNEGGKFKDVSKQAGILEQVVPGGEKRPCQGKSLGVTLCDFNNDGWPDIVVANDRESNYLFQNNKDGTFKEVGREAGVALSGEGIARAAMGVAAADIDHSGRESLLFTNFSNEMVGLYQNRGNGLFIDVAPVCGVGPASLLYLAFGCLFVDIDNDGWPDIFVANGHLDEDISKVNRDVTYAERPLLFHNERKDSTGQVRYQEIGLRSGEALKRPVIGRGAAYADIDLDGTPDLALAVNGGPAILLRNDGGSKNNAIRLVLEGTKSNRSGIGAVIEAKVGTETLYRMVRSGSSYLSQSELPVTLGLGKQPKADSIIIHWPSGTVTELKDVAANQIVTVDEDKGKVKEQPFRRR